MEQKIKFLGKKNVQIRYRKHNKGEYSYSNSMHYVYEVISSYCVDDSLGSIHTYHDTYVVIEHNTRPNKIFLEAQGVRDGEIFYDKCMSIPNILLNEVVNVHYNGLYWKQDSEEDFTSLIYQ